MTVAMLRYVLSFLAVTAFALCSVAPARAGYRLLHEFAGGANDGAQPHAGLAADGSTLYGTTYSGGGGVGHGTVFKIDTDGMGFQLLRKFVGGANDGSNPEASLTVDGATLYGTTEGGGNANRGTAFKMNSDGSSFQLLHKFAGGVNDGSFPLSPLTLDGSTLYGITSQGGDAALGTVFKINTDGTGHALLHEFSFGVNDGWSPTDALTRAGSTLFGTTEFGGQYGGGTVFKLNTDGTGFSLLHEFAQFVSPGPLMLDGSTLYGTTVGGGDGLGSVFKINTDGTGFQDLHEFAGNGNDLAFPYAPLTLGGSVLYGTTTNYEDGAGCTVFRVNIDGTGFAVIHQFVGGADDGLIPRDALTLVGSTLYGTTEIGGDSNLGTVFAIDIGIAGDYNNNGAVDAADYVLWRKGGPLANEVDAPGTVNEADYAAWLARFGNLAGSGAAASANTTIPEPAILVMVTVVAAGWYIK